MLLLVDSNDLFRSALASNLRDDGYQVAEYPSVPSLSLDELHQDVGALLIDCSNARENAVAFVDRFHRTFPNAPVIMIMAAGRRLKDRVADLSYVTVLPKPLDYESLAAMLRARCRCTSCLQI